MTNGERIKNYREQKGFSQTDLADMVGTTKQTIFKYENNIITNIPSDKVEKIAAALGVSPADLLGWDKRSTTLVLTNDETELIKAYRKASPDTQLAVKAVLGVKNDYIASSEVG
jgi:transcriptional regulator with XRE-family HTH domain